MTVASDTNRSGPYTGNGVTVAFDYGFRIVDETHLKIVRAEGGVETVLVLTSDYTVTGVGAAGGGQAIMTTAPTALQTVTALLNVPFTQETDLENQGAYYAETVESALDLAVMRDQQLQEQIDRAILIPASSDPTALIGLIDDIIRLSDSVANVDTVAGIAANVTTVAGIAADVSAAPANAAATAADRVQTGLDAAAAAASAAGVNLPAIVGGDAGNFLQVKGNETGYDLVTPAQVRTNIGLNEIGLFLKADTSAVGFTKTGVGTVSIKAGTVAEVDGSIYTFAVATAVTMPALTSGTDYAIWIKPDGTIEATGNFVTPPIAGARMIGGFHYAPGGNATGTIGGDTTPAINEFSLWDLKWRPACADPRGMTLVAGNFWVDIYLCGVDHYANGTSRYNVTIADGSSPPKVPALFGGNGSTAYSTFTWFEASLVMQSAGKALLTYGEYVAACYGTTEASSGGTDPVSTILRAASTSKWGLMLATGNLWQWADESASAIAAFLGGNWDSGAGSGSRVSNWSYAPSGSYSVVGARGRCDHLHHA